MYISRDQLERMIPGIDPDVWLDKMNDILERYKINNEKRIASFMANCAHESGNFNILEENLNYSAQGLMRSWPARFPTMEIATKYARNPKKIANRAYADRMGNGPESTGEGWKYRGRGLIQLTGKINYRTCSYDLFQDETLVDSPDLLLEPEYALHSACWFWDKNNINLPADREDHKKVCRIINGGLNGLEDRISRYEMMLPILEEEPSEPEQL